MLSTCFAKHCGNFFFLDHFISKVCFKAKILFECLFIILCRSIFPLTHIPTNTIPTGFQKKNIIRMHVNLYNTEISQSRTRNTIFAILFKSSSRHTESVVSLWNANWNEVNWQCWIYVFAHIWGKITSAIKIAIYYFVFEV